MDLQRKSLRVGAFAIVFALGLRLLGSGWLEESSRILENPRFSSFFIGMQTGRILRLEPVPTVQENSTPPQTEPAETPRQVSFSPGEAACLSVTDPLGLEPDLEALLQTPLSWDLKGDSPRVLILHTHGTESYENTQNYVESGEYRTLDENYNMLAVGDALAAYLESQGIAVLHDRTLHDYPSYNGSYENARATIQDYLARYPEICLVLDLHRDAADDGYGGQVRKAVNVRGVELAQVMFVVGTGTGGLNNPGWQENLALAVKLGVLLERDYKNITRPISLRSSRFNQDLCPGAMLVEVGAAGNTLEEAKRSMEALGRAIAALANGT